MEEMVPEIRFKDFEDNWKKEILGNISKTSIGEFIIKTKQNDNSPYPVFNGGTSYTGFYEDFNNEGNKIIVSGRGANAGFVNIARSRYWAGNSCYSIELFENIDIDFIYSQMKRKEDRFTEKQQAANIPSVSKKDVDEFVLELPSYNEQLNVGQFFFNYDSLIALQQQKLDMLKTLKKSCLEKMFPKEGETVPEVRFKGFEGPWEKIIFEEVVKRSSEQSADASLPRVEYEDIVSGIGTINKDLYQKNSHKSGIIFHKGDVLYGKLRPYLQNWLLAFFDGIAVGDFWVLQPQGIDSGFLYRLIQGRKFSDTANQSTGTKMPRADWKLVSKTAFFIPQNVNEQFVIGDFFMNLDSLIISSEQKLGQLKTLKKALLDRMFV